MLAKQCPVGSEVEHGVVDGGPVELTLVDADNEVHAGLASCFTEALRRGTGYDHGLIDEQGVPLGVPVPDRTRVDPDRRAGHEGLG